MSVYYLDPPGGLGEARMRVVQCSGCGVQGLGLRHE